MNMALWIVQGLLAAIFLMAGFMKLAQPKPTLQEKLGDWVDTIPGNGMKIIGLLEIAGAVGLILPMLFNIQPILTPVAAIGLALTMLAALLLHLSRSEYNKILPNIVFLVLTAFAAYGRLVLVPVI